MTDQVGKAVPGGQAHARPRAVPPVAVSVVRERRRLLAATRVAQVSRSGDGLHRLSELASRVLGTGAGHVCLVTESEDIVGHASRTPGGVRPLQDSICRLAVDGPVVVSDARADPRTEHVSLVRDGVIGSFLGEPLAVDEGLVVGSLCVFDPEPREWSSADREALRLLADAAVTELRYAELAAEAESARVRWSLAVDAGGIGSFDWDLETGVLSWDDRMLEIFGYDREGFDRSIEEFNVRVHPDDRARVDDAVARSVDGCADFEAEYRIVLPAGRTRWVRARGRTLGDLRGRPVRLLGAAYDTTAEQVAETRVARLLEVMPTALLSLDRDWRFTYVNSEAERVLGISRADLLAHSLWDSYPGLVGTDFEETYRRAVRTGKPQTIEAWYPFPLESWFEVRAWPTPDGLSLFFLDVSERRAAQERADRAARRLSLLAEVSAELTGVPDGPAGIRRLARTLVPELADGCVVTTVDDAGRPQDAGSWHRDPARRAPVQRYAEARLHAPSDPTVVRGALRLESARLYTREQMLASRPGDRVIRALDDLAVGAALAVPLRARGRTTGLLSLLYDEGRSPDDDDRATARDVADRAGVALDHARTFGRQRALAESLQRSLLTDPPEPDHLQVAVRYVPAAESARVGGDWYDAFLQRSGATVLVIGDVVGHDTEAAAAMGQLRGLLRGIAAYSDAGPAELLRGLDDSLRVLGVRTLATVAVARFEQTPEEVERAVTRMVWASAGHPPPVVLDADGGLAVLGGWSGDLLLGVDPTVVRREHTEVLARGSTVLLYTDGLIERRDADLDAGLDRLTGTLQAVAERPLEEICDVLVDRLVDGRPEDDVALVAVRLHPQDAAGTAAKERALAGPDGDRPAGSRGAEHAPAG